MFEVVVRRCRLVPAMEQAVGMPGLLGEEGCQRAERTSLPVGVEMYRLVDEGADQRPVAPFASCCFCSSSTLAITCLRPQTFRASVFDGMIASPLLGFLPHRENQCAPL